MIEVAIMLFVALVTCFFAGVGVGFGLNKLLDTLKGLLRDQARAVSKRRNGAVGVPSRRL